MVGVKFTAVNLDAWYADFKRFGIDLTSVVMARALQGIKKLFQEDEKQLFGSEGAKGKAGKWPKLSDAYKAWKQKHYPGKTIMIRTERLMKSLTGENSESVQTLIRDNPKTLTLRLGTLVSYAEYHQRGIKSKRGILVRKTLDPTNRQLQLWIKEIQKEVVKESKKRMIAFKQSNEPPRAMFDRIK